MSRVRVLPAAQSEIRAAARWYEARHEGLGIEFVALVDEALAKIADRPQLRRRGERTAPTGGAWFDASRMRYSSLRTTTSSPSSLSLINEGAPDTGKTGEPPDGTDRNRSGGGREILADDAWVLLGT